MLGRAATLVSIGDSRPRSKCTFTPTPTTHATSANAPSQLRSLSRRRLTSQSETATNTIASRATLISKLVLRGRREGCHVRCG